jgi:UDP-glucose 4-epimerase
VDNPIKNYVQHTLSDTDKAEKLLGFKARYELEDGIRELLDFTWDKAVSVLGFEE